MTALRPGDRVRFTPSDHDETGTVVRTGTDPYANAYAVVDLPTRRIEVGVAALELVERRSTR